MNKHKLLLKKREICQPYLNMVNTKLAQALRQKIIDGDPAWTFVAGVRHGNFCSWEKERENVTLEEFTHLSTFEEGWHGNLLCTYPDCIEICVLADLTDQTDIEFVRITVWDGGDVLRCTLYLSGPWWTIKVFQDQIEDRWIWFTDRKVQLEEEARLKRRRVEVAEALLSGTYPAAEDSEWT